MWRLPANCRIPNAWLTGVGVPPGVLIEAPPAQDLNELNPPMAGVAGNLTWHTTVHAIVQYSTVQCITVQSAWVCEDSKT